VHAASFAPILDPVVSNTVIREKYTFAPHALHRIRLELVCTTAEHQQHADAGAGLRPEKGAPATLAAFRSFTEPENGIVIWINGIREVANPRGV
jgi:hypothetical protein